MKEVRVNFETKGKGKRVSEFHTSISGTAEKEMFQMKRQPNHIRTADPVSDVNHLT